MKKFISLSLLLMGCIALRAEIKTPAVIGEHMVLQRNTQAHIWGWSSPNSHMTAETSWNNKLYSMTADAEGRWDFAIETGDATFTPQTITICEYKPSEYRAGRSSIRYQSELQLFDRITIGDVLVGEVWLAAGQSNMEMPLKGFADAPVLGGTADATSALRDNPGVRMMTVEKGQKMEPQNDCRGEWTDARFPNPMNWSATAYYFASALSQSLQIPVGIVTVAYGGSKVESWMSRDLLKNYSDVDLKPEHIMDIKPDYLRPMMMYNAMFCPVKDYTYKGIIWYQGESNVGKGPSAKEYAKRLAAMVKAWRAEIGLGDIPFLQVEIAPFVYGGDQAGYAAYLREQQCKASAMIPNSHIISTNDLVEDFEKENIHPREKKKIGQRLYWTALNRVYGFPQVCCAGPRYKALDVKADSCFVTFYDLQMGKNRQYDVVGFEIAGPDHVFYPAEFTQLRWNESQVVVVTSKVKNPVAVRYCFHDFVIGNLTGGNDLPAYPFRSDSYDW